MTAREFITHVKGVKRAGNGWTARCPAHDDQHASLSISDGSDGKLLLKCHAGCDFETIIASVPHANGSSQIIAEYDYCDEKGELLYQAVRFAPKAFRARTPDSKGGWEWKLNGARRVPYRLPQLLNANPDKTVCVVEGEKDADRLWDLGIVATTNVGGAGKWRDEYSKQLRGRKVVIIPDNDEPGRNHAHQVACSLQGIAESIKVVGLPGLPDKGDVSDWLAKGNGIKELRTLVEATPEFELAEKKPSSDALSIVCIKDVNAESVEWLWEPYIPKRKITIVEGEEGIGKSWAMCAIACAVSLGQGLPRQGSFPPANVLLMSAEDGLSDTVRPRLEAMGADLSRIFAVDEPLTFDDKGLLRLRDAIIQYKPILVIVDPLFAYVGGKLDINSPNQSRAISARLANIADDDYCAMVLLRHIGKARGGGDPRVAGLGSIDWRAASRSGLLFGLDRETGERGFVHTKHNLSPEGEPIGYSLEGGRFTWTTSCSLTYSRVLSNLGTDEERQARTSAEQTLREVLAEPRQAKDAQREMRDAGFTEDQTRRARERLGVKPTKEGFGSSRWIWRLPEDGNEDGEGGSKLDSCHLRASETNKGSYSNELPEDGKVILSSHLREGCRPVFTNPDDQKAWDSWREP